MVGKFIKIRVMEVNRRDKMGDSQLLKNIYQQDCQISDAVWLHTTASSPSCPRNWVKEIMGGGNLNGMLEQKGITRNITYRKHSREQQC